MLCLFMYIYVLHVSLYSLCSLYISLCYIIWPVDTVNLLQLVGRRHRGYSLGNVVASSKEAQVQARSRWMSGVSLTGREVREVIADMVQEADLPLPLYTLCLSFCHLQPNALYIAREGIMV